MILYNYYVVVTQMTQGKKILFPFEQCELAAQMPRVQQTERTPGQRAVQTLLEMIERKKGELSEYIKSTSFRGDVIYSLTPNSTISTLGIEDKFEIKFLKNKPLADKLKQKDIKTQFPLDDLTLKYDSIKNSTYQDLAFVRTEGNIDYFIPAARAYDFMKDFFLMFSFPEKKEQVISVHGFGDYFNRMPLCRINYGDISEIKLLDLCPAYHTHDDRILRLKRVIFPEERERYTPKLRPVTNIPIIPYDEVNSDKSKNMVILCGL